MELFVEISNFKRIDSGCLLGSFDVFIPEWGLTIAECKLFEKDGRKWVGFPSRQAGSRYVELVSMSKEKKERFSSSCLEKLSAMISQAASSSPVPF